MPVLCRARCCKTVISMQPGQIQDCGLIKGSNAKPLEDLGETSTCAVDRGGLHRCSPLARLQERSRDGDQLRRKNPGIRKEATNN